MGHQMKEETRGKGQISNGGTEDGRMEGEMDRSYLSRPGGTDESM